MTFDEQIKGAFDTITDLLREEIGRQVQSVVKELADSAHTRSRTGRECRTRDG